jgi:Mrp family chromosome partitioning ATPase
MSIFRRKNKEKNQKDNDTTCPLSKEKKDEKTCETCKLSTTCKDKKIEEKEKIRHSIQGIKHKIVVMSGKGGVGKSTVAASLAVSLVNQGKSVGLLDVDVHGPSVPGLLGLKGARANMTADKMLEPVLWKGKLKVMSLGFLLPDEKEAVIWRGPVKMQIIKQFISEVDWGALDFLIVDCPPGTGDEPLTALQSLGQDTKVIIVTTPQSIVIDDVRRSITFCKKVGNEIIGIIENMSGFKCPACGEQHDLFGSGAGRELSREMGVPFLGRIPLNAKIALAADEGEASPDIMAEIVQTIDEMV